jgi:hypothetical protein
LKRLTGWFHEIHRILHHQDTVMVEAARTSETSVNFTMLHGATNQKTAIFTLAAVGA